MTHGKKHGKKELEAIAVRCLTKAELRITRPRLAVLAILIQSHGPFTMEELHKRVEKEDIDPVTVYRCIASFQESGIVGRCDFGDGPVRFEYRGEGSEHHHHVVCTKCRKIRSLDFCLVEGIEKILKKEGYSHISHSLEFFAVCAKCSPPPSDPPNSKLSGSV